MKKNTLLILQILILLSGCSTKYEKDGYVICLSKDFVGIAVDLHFKTIRFKKGTEYNNEVFSSITEIYIDEIVEKSEIFLFSSLLLEKLNQMKNLVKKSIKK